MGVAIRTAGAGDREAVVRLLDAAFQDDPVSGWVFPDPAHRRATHHRLMAAFADISFAEGWVDVTEDASACALWLHVPAAGGADPNGDVEDTTDGGTDDVAGARATGGGEPAGRRDGDDGGPDTDTETEAGDGDGPARLRAAVDPDNERVELIGRLTADVHPSGRAHAYLWMIAVAPERQGGGLGSALVTSVLDRCDREGLAAYLEASNARSRALYERLGFALTGGPLDLPDGPRMWPMWREPRTTRRGNG